MPSSFDPDLIKMIRCPVTKSQLTLASPEVIDELNAKIETGSLVNHVGQTVTAKLESGFINEGSSLLLPVRGGIVILISDQAIPLD